MIGDLDAANQRSLRKNTMRSDVCAADPRLYATRERTSGRQRRMIVVRSGSALE